MKSVIELKTKLFADGAEKASMLELYANPLIQGFTTNPTLMRKAGITDYEAFARDIVKAIPDRPISLEVFADEFPEMERQGRKIATWGPNVYVKIPVTNTRQRVVVRPDPPAVPRGRQVERYRNPHLGPGKGCRGSTGRGRSL